MDINSLTSLISSVGFPAVCVLAMGFFIWQLYQQSVDRENKLYIQIDEGRKVNAQAIATISLYAERLDAIQEDVKEIRKDVTTIINKTE